MPRQRSCVLACVLALFVHQSSANSEPQGETYAPWFPGDALAIVDQQDHAWEHCFSRDPADCPRDWISVGQVKRISPQVIQTPGGEYMCNASIPQGLGLNRAFCTRDGWVAPDCPEHSPFCVTGRFRLH